MIKDIKTIPAITNENGYRRRNAIVFISWCLRYWFIPKVKYNHQ
jgi:hypothetical protein